MKRQTFSLLLVLQILFRQFVFGQESSVVNVSVKQNNGRKEKEISYRNSFALLIGNSLPDVERDIPQIEAVLRNNHGFTVGGNNPFSL